MSTPVIQYGTAPTVPVASSPPSGSYTAGAFPIDLEKQPFWMSFSFYSYEMPSLTNQNSLTFQDQGTIRLPLPNSMVDSQNVEYSIEGLSLVSGLAVNQLRGGNLAGAGAIGGASAAVNAFKNTKLGSAITNDAAGIFGGFPVANVLQTQGVVVNPFLTVMFKQPAFKQHGFSWKLSPSNQDESKRLNSIVNTFRANMLPDQAGSSGGTLLTYPNIVQITISVNDPTYFSYIFKPAVIQSFNINFSPNGQAAMFGSTKAPTEVEISMQLLEIEYWLSSDWGLGTNVNPIGLIKDLLGNIGTPAAGQTPQ